MSLTNYESYRTLVSSAIASGLIRYTEPQHAEPSPTQPKRTLRQSKRAIYQRKYQRQLRKKRVTMGLTAAGRVRKARGRLTTNERTEARMTYDRIRMDANLARGLTAMGRVRKRKSKHCPEFKRI